MQIRCKGDLCFMFLLCIIFTKYRFFVAFPPLILYNKIRILYNRMHALRTVSYTHLTLPTKRITLRLLL